MLIAHTSPGAHDSIMFKRSLSRGTSIVAALALVGMLSIALVFTQILLPNTSAISQTASVWDAPSGGAGNLTLTPPALPVQSGNSLSNKSPVDCEAAKRAAVGKIADPGTMSTDTGTSGTVDSCHSAISTSGKMASVNDYTCYGRSGTVVIANGMVTVQTNPDKSLKDGDCNVKVCNGGLSNCSAAKKYEGGIFASSVIGVTDGGAAPGMNYVASLSGTAGASMGPATGYYVDANGAVQISNAFNPGTAPSPAPSGWGPIDNSPSQWPQGGSSAASLSFAPTNANGDLTPYAVGLQGCSEGNSCNTLTKEDLTPEAAAPKGSCPLGQVWLADSGCNEYKDGKYTPVGPETPACSSGQIKDQSGNCVAASTFRQPPANPPAAPQAPTKPDSSGGGGGIAQALQSMLSGLMKGLGGAGAAAGGAACPSDPTAYAAQQQQYQQQLQQYNYQMQQYQYQQQYGGGGYQVISTNPVTVVPTGGGATIAPPVAPVACTPTSSSNTCAAAPAQPASGCPAGTTIRPVTSQGSNGATCTTGWQCAASNATTPTAQLSCQPQVADVGMMLTISYGCTNATGSTGSGFDSLGATSGSTTTVLTAPPTGVNKATFGITCINQNLSGQASCDVQVSKPSIVLVANPKVVATSTASTVGWVTSGMSSCVISSPQQADFTATNAGNTSVNGMATTSPITEDTDILLHCVTLGGGTRDATTTIVTTGSNGGQQTGTITVNSSADGSSIARGSINTISWSSANPPSGSKMSLWLYDVRLGVLTALIANELSASSTYAWTLPTSADTCDANSNVVCSTDLVPGRQYGIEADMYTGNPTNATYGAQGYTSDVFTITQ